MRTFSSSRWVDAARCDRSPGDLALSTNLHPIDWHFVSNDGRFDTSVFSRGVGEGDVDGDGLLDLMITDIASSANTSGGMVWLITGDSLQ